MADGQGWALTPEVPPTAQDDEPVVLIRLPETAPAEPVERQPAAPRRLVAGPRPRRRTLVLLDAVALASAWILAGLTSAPIVDRWLLTLPLSVLAGIVVLRAHRMYRARTLLLRSTEVLSTLKAAGTLTVVGVAIGAATRLGRGFLPIAVFVAAAVPAILAGRAAYRAVLRRRSDAGIVVRPVLLIGGSTDALDLHALLEDHPDLGFRVVGTVGPRGGWSAACTAPWLGGLEDLEAVVAATGATGALIEASGLTSREVNAAVRELHRLRVHVHLSSGLRGFAHRRLHVMPLAHEPLLYVEPARLHPIALAAKRVVDVTVASIVLLAVSPVLVLAAIAIRSDDGGPVLFRQARVGKDRLPFTILKLRTMSVDAEARRAELARLNQRQGPLFKVAADPRVTRVGRFLRASSIDELPQLVNVIRGEMSLVGPRPALPDEVATFDEQLLARTTVKPGVTGLWQVEARDNDSFGAYRRLDLFYVENWSLGLDLTILAVTVPVVIARGLRAIRRTVGGMRAATILE